MPPRKAHFFTIELIFIIMETVPATDKRIQKAIRDSAPFVCKVQILDRTEKQEYAVIVMMKF